MLGKCFVHFTSFILLQADHKNRIRKRAKKRSRPDIVLPILLSSGVKRKTGNKQKRKTQRCQMEPPTLVGKVVNLPLSFALRNYPTFIALSVSNCYTDLRAYYRFVPYGRPEHCLTYERENRTNLTLSRNVRGKHSRASVVVTYKVHLVTIRPEDAFLCGYFSFPGISFPII